MALTAKQQRFVEEYLTSLNATQAAVAAGYTAKRADQAGFQLLRKTEIQDAIQARQHALQQQAEVTQVQVIDELKVIAFADLRHYLQWDDTGVQLLPSADLSAQHARAVKQIVVNKDGSMRLVLHDKAQALDMLARHLGLFQPEGVTDWQHMPALLSEAKAQLLDSLEAMAQRRSDAAAGAPHTGFVPPTGEAFPLRPRDQSPQ